ncbi:DUF4190 domain-containing protein [Streptomyces ficellus]|uniref:DUF4352 domain-containing protein n=1 Tax=Streptomyces ficellus TaxID=1977088 RepID=A0A6I6FRG6_9ACTN|nr:DUF4190 domain-containing protein [Streptomyces ficellus]QGV80228.1 DUF4352 domain-containing protein [Streptomyces ficellus]
MSDFTQQPQNQHGSHQPYPGPYGGAPAPQPQPVRNGLGTAALVLGVIGALAGVIPLLFWVAGVLGVLALILGLSGRGRAKRGEAANKGVATAGAVLGLVAMILSVVGAVIVFKAASDVVEEVDKALDSASTAPKDPSTAESGAPAAEETPDGKPLAAGDASVYDDDLQVSVSAPKPVEAGEYAIGHTEGNKVYEVSIVVENGGKKAFASDSLAVSARAGAEGATAEEIFDGDTYGKGFTGTVLPGKKATVKYAFDAPADAKTLTVEVTPGFDYNPTQWELTL